MNGRILITGGAGFIGVHLARRLETDGYTVHLVDNYIRGIRDPELERLVESPKITLSVIDLSDRHRVLELGTDFDVIIHLAAIVGVVHVLERPYEVLTKNTLTLDNVIALANRQKNLLHFLFASTSEVYAGTLKSYGVSIPTPEDSILTVPALDEPRTTYMLSKIFGEAMCQQARLPFTIFRPHNVYGPRMGMAHVIPEQLKKTWEARPGGTLSVESAEHRRAFCYIDDAVEMIIRILDTDSCVGRTLNLGTETPEVTIRQVVQMCVRASGKTLTIKTLPPTQGSPRRRAPDMRLTRHLLNYESQVSLSEGIAQTWEWYRENIFKGAGLTAR